jgi:histidinol-phosphatase (PHP family)
MYIQTFPRTAAWEWKKCAVQALSGICVEIAVTDHLDIDYPDRDFQFDLDYAAYSDAIDHAREKYNGRLNIVKGLEIGLQPHILDECAAFLEGKDFQFVIASVHAVSGMDLSGDEYSPAKNEKSRLYRVSGRAAFVYKKL